MVPGGDCYTAVNTEMIGLRCSSPTRGVEAYHLAVTDFGSLHISGNFF